MPYRFFSIPTTHGDDAERELNTFLAQHQNVRVDKQFVPDGERSFWAVAVTYAAAAKAPSGGTREIPADYKPKVNYEETLTPAQYLVFNELRDLRNQIAEQTKVVPFNIFNNAELAAMVTGNARTVADLQKIPGVGKKKAESHGEAFLEKLRESMNGTEAPAGQGLTDEDDGKPF